MYHLVMILKIHVIKDFKDRILIADVRGFTYHDAILIADVYNLIYYHMPDVFS